MKLQIRYSENVHSPVHAAYLRGSDPRIWLKEIDNWNMTADEIACYPMPHSIHSPELAGIFIVFKNSEKVKTLDLIDAYTYVQQRLFIPCNVVLMPQVSNQELSKILLWNVQVFHPQVGLIGFEPKDKISLSELFIYHPPLQRDWSFAHPGRPAQPMLTEIEVTSPPADELIQSMKEDIGQKPLDDIPAQEGDPNAVEKLIDKVKYVLFRSIHSTIEGIGRLLPPASAAGNSSGKEGLIQKFQNWLAKNIGELKKKRNEEIQRLLKLFDENTNEALQYAIPLDSPYLKRGGSESASSKLSKKPLNFNLGKLGGGAAVDSWDLGDQYFTLRTKYMNAAQREIEKKDFRKAAYIYAHLLGDYHSAANTLKQGSHFREAATLYKDHLKNITAAADCLEEGGLLLESIELNKTLNRDEKVGDLYKMVNQRENADEYFERHVKTKLSQADHLDAARVVDEKMEQNERARDILMDGWSTQTYQNESCLKKYFEIMPKREHDSIAGEVKDIYTKSTPRHKRQLLLNVMEWLNKKQKDETLANTTREIAYDIVHEEAKLGNISSLLNLKKFLPGDKLIGSDTSRYVNSNRFKLLPPSSTSPLTSSFSLDPSIRWIKAVWQGHQFLVLGIKNAMLHLARCNWYGNIEYYSWTNTVGNTTRFTFISNPNESGVILLHASDGLPVTRKHLQRNKYFAQSLMVYCPVWLHKGTAQFILKGDKIISRVEIDNGAMTRHEYSIEGQLHKSVNCFFDGDKEIQLSSFRSNPLVAWHNGVYFTYVEKYFIEFNELGDADVMHFDTIIRFFATSSGFAQFRILISTNKGCCLYEPGDARRESVRHNFFASDIIPTSIAFIQSDRFVIVSKTIAHLYEIRDNKAVKIQEYIRQSPIVAAIPTSGRNTFALVETSGRITLCEIEAQPIIGDFKE